MNFDGFIGPAYRARSLASSGDLLQNLYAEPVESGKGASPIALYGTPGSELFLELDDAPVRGFCELNGRVWAVAGTHLYELFDNATSINLGVLAGAGGNTPASLVTDGKTVIIAASGKAFAFSIGTGVIAVIPTIAGAGLTSLMDGFFIASVPQTRLFQISQLNDGSIWKASDFAAKNGFPDNLVGQAVVRRQLWLMGNRTSEVWWLSGNVNFPFERLQGVFLETGLAAAASLSVLDESLFWLGQSKRGKAIVYRAAGYAPNRVSTFAIEFAMASYSRIDDAVGYSYEEGGHVYYVLTFPSAIVDPVTGVKTGRTWAYDLATKWWHERAWLNPLLGTQEAIRGWVHVFAFDRHLVGDRESGKVYRQALGIYTDAGNPIRRVRRAPVLTFELKQTFFHRLDLHLQMGVVPQEPAPGWLPIFNLRISRDGGFTFGPEIDVAGGEVGQYDARVFWGPLGASRRAVFEISSSEPIEHCWIGAYLEATPGNS